MRLSRIGIVIGITAAWACVASFAATPAQAGLLSCGNGSQTFQPVDGDATTYYSMANGGFESGSSGWSLSGGASVVSGNEPWSVAGGTHSLSLPSGSSAVGPKTCIALLSPALRMFASDAGGKDGGLRVTIEYRSLLGALLGIKSYTLFDPAAYKRWQPTQQVQVPLSLLTGVPLLTAYFQMRLTPVGAGSNWLVDDVYVDPFVHGM